MFTVCAIGSAAIDIKARLARPALDTTDVPGRITLTPGGVSRNIAENLARLGAQAIFIGVLGDDVQGRYVLEHGRAAGIDVRPIVRSAWPTASLAIVIDPAGRQIAGVFSGDILHTLTPADLHPHLETIRAAQALVFDAGAPEAVLAYLADVARPGTMLYGNPGSVALAARLSAVLEKLTLLTCNRFEAEALIGTAIQSEADALHAARRLVARGVQHAIVTLGARGMAYADASRCEHRPAQPARLIDATGAGDALAAALIFARLRGASIDAALTLGLRAAALTCEAQASVSPVLSLTALHNT